MTGFSIKDKAYPSEGRYQRELVSALVYFGFDVQVHNDVGWPSVPDLSFSGHGFDGWVEVKYIRSGMVECPADIDHFTAGQKNWLNRHGKSGSGHCYLIVGSPGNHQILKHGDWSKMKFSKTGHPTVGAVARALCDLITGHSA